MVNGGMGKDQTLKSSLCSLNQFTDVINDGGDADGSQFTMILALGMKKGYQVENGEDGHNEVWLPDWSR